MKRTGGGGVPLSTNFLKNSKILLQRDRGRQRGSEREKERERERRVFLKFDT